MEKENKRLECENKILKDNYPPRIQQPIESQLLNSEPFETQAINTQPLEGQAFDIQRLDTNIQTPNDSHQQNLMEFNDDLQKSSVKNYHKLIFKLENLGNYLSNSFELKNMNIKIIEIIQKYLSISRNILVNLKDVRNRNYGLAYRFHCKQFFKVRSKNRKYSCKKTFIAKFFRSNDCILLYESLGNVCKH